VVWDPVTDSGHQLSGLLEEVREVATLDGYSPALEAHPVPQVESELLIRIAEGSHFSQAPHTDEPE